MKTIEPESAEKIARQIVDLMQSKNIDNCSELQKWMALDESAAHVTEKFSSPEVLTQLCETFTASSNHEEQATRLLKTLEKRKRRSLVYKISSGVAATVFTALLIGYNINEKPIPTTAKTHPLQTTKINTIKPILLLENGDQIDLSDNIITNDFVVENNKLNYKQPKEVENQQEVKYNTLYVPKQFTFKIELADGTEVTLNANSELHYPTTFRGNSREVFLKGEAHFHVKKSDKPFIVKTEKCSVKVYGTQFNINSYSPNNIVTTLIEGSVGVTVSQTETMIKPNEIFRVGVSGTGVVEKIDVAKQLSWLNGEINSYDEPLNELLTKISNWYGVKFTYDDEIKQIKVRTSLNNDLPLEDILTAIVKITGVKIDKIKEGIYMIK